ncbi:hypothetical protein K466DRAFT_604253 [Polyporus arcularius HHB13444]|uniref:Uncharacterized protein n=1 Tax=Polyporus arcularius HHB13444 TaxID=1314778 RepID=A0A5C3NXD8_9APHY|nr:hypothetical protein K466DRAFT_604253 [Polyporus arcularius HHB13444]
MPEYTEVLACHYTLRRWFDDVKDKTCLKLQGISADGTKAEIQAAKKEDATTRLAQGLVYPLNCTSRIKRGSKTVQQYVWPHIDEQTLGTLDGMVLRDVIRTPRTIVLDFGQYGVQVQLLTHTLAQPYTHEQYHDEIMQVSCIDNRRGFRVGFAFEFEEYTLAFLSADLLISPNWFKMCDPYPHQHIDLYLEWPRFLKAVGGIVQDRHTAGFYAVSRKCQQRLATTAIREEHGHIFGGIGVYTVSEAFARAGLSVFLKQDEVWACPSRTARLCEAVWTIAHRAHTQLRTLIDPCFAGYILAPTIDHRLLYSYWLLVHGKQHVFMPVRTKALLLAYENRLAKQSVWPDGIARGWCRGEDIGLHDVFEPTWIRPALEEKDLSLGQLIFGELDWEVLNDIEPGMSPFLTDPLSATYRELGMLRSSDGRQRDMLTYLHPLTYFDGLFVSDEASRAARAEARLYTSQGQKQLWTILPVFPRYSVSNYSVVVRDPAQLKASRARILTELKKPPKRKPKKPANGPKTKGSKAKPTVEAQALDDEGECGEGTEESPKIILDEDGNPFLSCFKPSSIIAPFDLYSLAPSGERNTKTFVEVVKSLQVAVGPLEYCALGQRVVRAGPKGKDNWMLVVCNDSPRLAEHYLERQRATLARKSKTKSKSAAAAAAATARKRKLKRNATQAALQNVRPDNISPADTQPRPAKRVRLSIDAKLAQGLM